MVADSQYKFGRARKLLYVAGWSHKRLKNVENKDLRKVIAGLAKHKRSFCAHCTARQHLALKYCQSQTAEIYQKIAINYKVEMTLTAVIIGYKTDGRFRRWVV